MEFSLSRDVLLKLLKYASGIIEKKISHDNILAQFLLRAQGSRLELVAADKDLELMCGVDGVVLPEFLVCLPFRKIYEICKVLGGGVSMLFSFQSPKELTIRAAQGLFVVPLYAHQQLPRIEPVVSGVSFSVDRDSFLKALLATAFVVVEQDMHAFVNGLLFEVVQNTLSVVATDGHRLAEAIVPLAGGAVEQSSRCIVPKKGIMELMRLLSDFSAQVVVRVGEAQVSVIGDNMSFTSRLLVGAFPGHMNLVNPAGGRRVRIERVLLKEALMRVIALFFEAFCVVRLNIGAGWLVLSSQTPEYDKVEDRIPLEYQGEAFTIGFNGRYLFDALNHLTGSVVDLIFAQNDSMVAIDPQESIKYVIMPLLE